MKKCYKISLLLMLVISLFFKLQQVEAQCTFASYSLAGNICANPIPTITMSGSQPGVYYQLKMVGYNNPSNPTNVGSAIAGNGGTISWSNISRPSDGVGLLVYATEPPSCTTPVEVASASLMLSSLSTSDVTITASNTVLYPGDSIIFTVTKSQTANPLLTFTNYRLINGSIIGDTTSNNVFIVKSQQIFGGAYSIAVNSSCGSVTVPCPSFTTIPPINVGSLSLSNGNVLNLTGTTGGSGNYIYSWQSSNDGITWSPVSGTMYNTVSYTAPVETWATDYRVQVRDAKYTAFVQNSNIALVPGLYNGAPTTPPNLSSSQNYIATLTTEASITDTGLLKSKPLSDVKLSVQYFDGLGRPKQTVVKQGSLITNSITSGDLVTFNLYDGFGRDSATFLPYLTPTTDGSYKTDAIYAQSSFYNSSNYTNCPDSGQGEIGGNAHSLTVYEASPLNRVLENFAAGNSWLGTSTQPTESARHSVKQKYWVNSVKDSVRIWNYTYPTLGSWGSYSSPTSPFYAAGTLYKNVTIDEAGHQVIVYKDKDGHTILKKVQLTAIADEGTDNTTAYAGWLCTYYVYDDFGNLRCVVQPEGVKWLSANSWNLTNTTILAEQCFRYEYDQRNRMIMKQVPGAQPVYMVYDNRGRLVMTQDAALRLESSWVATRYDNLNRADTTWLDSLPSTTFNTLLTAAAATNPYPATLPTSANILTATHYDDYAGVTFPTGVSGTYKNTGDSYLMTASNTNFPYPQQPTQITTTTPITTKGLVTWAQTKILNSSPVIFITTVNIYDDKGRIIQTQRNNITNGVEVNTTQYSWSGQPLVTVNWQSKLSTRPDTSIVVTRMTYDNLGRLVKTEMQQSNSKVNGGAMSALATISEIQYDALGQVKKKLLGNQRSSATTYSSNPLETQDFDYNIRGWLLGVNRAYAKDISSTDTTNTTTQADGGEIFIQSIQGVNTVVYPATHYFGFDLGYDNINGVLINNLGYDTARYDGNIAGMVWKNAYDTKVRKYDFSYDAVNRLTAAGFGQYTGHAFTNATVNYNVNNLSYDANGNIKTMNQYGLKSGGSSAVIDQLTYTYQTNSNKLAKVADAAANDSAEHLGDFQDGTNSGDDYAYDGNGNMISDQNKKISSITYNYLNLPDVIRVSGRGSIYYTYDAAGNKLRKVTVDSTVLPAKITTTLYIGNSVYQNDTLQFFGTSEGRARPVGNAFVYDYFLKDQLGNTRMVITDDYNVPSPILEATSYYPFGLQQKGIGLDAALQNQHNKKRYNGIEFDEDLSINMDEAFYRFHDPQIGRFLQTDPKIESAEPWSPYSAMLDNPILNSDPLGDSIPYLSYIPNFQTNSTYSSLSDFTGSVDNGVINILNTIPALLNTVSANINAFSSGTWTKQMGQDLSSMWSGIKSGVSNFKLSDLGSALKNPHTLSNQITLFGGGMLLGRATEGMSSFSLKSISSSETSEFSLSKAAKGGAEGGLNLFKFGKPTTTTAEGWKTGDRMLNMFDQGSPKLNWKQNSGFLRREMRSGNPIFDSYRYPNGQQIPTGGFLNAERNLLESRGWIYNPSTGAYHP